MQNDAEILKLIINEFPNLENEYKELVVNQPVYGDAYEFTILTFLPYAIPEIKNKNDDVTKRMASLLSKMLSSEDETVVNFGVGIIIENLAYEDIDHEYFFGYANDKVKAEMQHLIDYYGGKTRM